MLYQAPDIRKQKIEEAEAFISAKRARRMIVLMTYKQKRAEKLSTIKESEIDKFTKHCNRFEKLMEKVEADINRLSTMAKTIGDIHNRIVNVENEEINL